ncbi:aspartate aminotransferase cytoplasmic [Fusarium tjaetaba]|uniref:Aspartate aminotransferase n=1 Tax=Fusarium tjaetaba TaxID=1567544 RepID=A0A8H5VH98_9HYPO|nr:aspartate aminotransferase cytoplasmic [Fusarium tjaetaba]KAF5622248.1 aspartate aminotransferase cytoplasmic [Fusarium tjaetaba]
MSAQQHSAFGAAKYIPPDPIFEVTKRFNADQHPQKVNLGQGTYRDENAKPWVLPSVREAEKLIGDAGHEYLPIEGLRSFRDEATKLLFHDTSALTENRIASCQSISGTGSLLLAGLVLRKANSGIENIIITDPTWSNHDLLFKEIGFNVVKAPYYKDRNFDFEGYISALKKADKRSAVVLHACAHNPTGCDPTRDQWKIIAAVIKENEIFPIIDSAYLGFNSGNYDEDAWAIKYIIEDVGLEAAICMSFAKNMGLYGERVGLTAIVTKSEDAKRTVFSLLQNAQRQTVSNPPVYGARIAATVLGNPELLRQWHQDLVTMSSRIRSMRKKLYGELVRLGTPGHWSHIVNQTGMFGYTGISKPQIEQLEEQYHIYMANTSRISLAGLNDHNVEFEDYYETNKLSVSCADPNLIGLDAGFLVDALGPSSTIKEQITDLGTPHRSSHASPQILRGHADLTRAQNSNTTPELNARSKFTGVEQDPSITAPHQPQCLLHQTNTRIQVHPTPRNINPRPKLSTPALRQDKPMHGVSPPLPHVD